MKAAGSGQDTADPRYPNTLRSDTSSLQREAYVN